MGLSNDYRISFSIIEKGKEGADHKVLAVGLPNVEVQQIRDKFAANRPSLIDLEISGLAALNTFSGTEYSQDPDGAVCYMEAGAKNIVVSFFLDGELRLVRKLDYGSAYIQQRIQEVLDIDEDEALTILFEDATPLLSAAIDPIGGLTQEISISQKFVERNENSKVVRVFSSGGLSYSPYFTYVMSRAIGVEIETWNPLLANGIKSCPQGIQGVESMFCSRHGRCHGSDGGPMNHSINLLEEDERFFHEDPKKSVLIKGGVAILVVAIGYFVYEDIKKTNRKKELAQELQSSWPELEAAQKVAKTRRDDLDWLSGEADVLMGWGPSRYNIPEVLNYVRQSIPEPYDECQFINIRMDEQIVGIRALAPGAAVKRTLICTVDAYVKGEFRNDIMLAFNRTFKETDGRPVDVEKVYAESIADKREYPSGSGQFVTQFQIIIEFKSKSLKNAGAAQ